jgi:hypothetical protein
MAENIIYRQSLGSGSSGDKSVDIYKIYSETALLSAITEADMVRIGVGIGDSAIAADYAGNFGLFRIGAGFVFQEYSVSTSGAATWGDVTGNILDQSDLVSALDLKATVSALALKAPIASPAFTGTVTGITQASVNLGNVDNTSDANKPISTVTQTALDLKATASSVTLKAPIASPTFTGTVAGVTKSMVGLANADNTTDLLKPLSTASIAALALKKDKLPVFSRMYSIQSDTKPTAGTFPVAFTTIAPFGGDSGNSTVTVNKTTGLFTALSAGYYQCNFGIINHAAATIDVSVQPYVNGALVERSIRLGSRGGDDILNGYLLFPPILLAVGDTIGLQWKSAAAAIAILWDVPATDVMMYLDITKI